MFKKLIQLDNIQFFCYLLICFIFFVEFLRSQSLISTIFIWSGILCYRKYRKCVEKSGATNGFEITQSLLGLFVDLEKTVISSVHLSSNLKVGDEIFFTIIPYNSYAKRFSKKIDGWEVNITGTTRIIPDYQSFDDGTIHYSCTMRKTGKYKINVSFRGLPLSSSPIQIDFHSGDIEPKLCQVVGLSNGGFPITPDDVISVGVISFDALGNIRETGGLSHLFQIQFKEKSKKEWKELKVETEDQNDGRYDIFFQIPEIGTYDLRVTFSDVEISSSLSVIVLQPELLNQIRRYLKKKTASFQVTMSEFPKTSIKLHINQSQISFRVYKCLNLIRWKKIETIKMTRSLTTIPDEGYSGLTIINPSYMQNVHCLSDETTLISATISAFLHTRDAGMHTGRFEERRKVFYTEIVKKHAKLGNVSPIVLQVDRNNILESTYRRINKLSNSNTSKFWKSQWRVIFIGERGIDEGGLRRELLTILTRELFDPSGPWKLFDKICDEVDNIHPVTNFPPPSSSSGNTLSLSGGSANSNSSKILSKYEFAGKVLAKTVYDTVVLDPCLVNVHFSCSFYKQLLDLPIHYSDFAKDDPQYFLSKIKYLIETNIDDAYLDLNFTEEEITEDANGVKTAKEIELKQGGSHIIVTDENKREYLLLLANYRLAHKVQKQIQAFAKGFYSILPRKLINIFDEKELELLICGLPNLDVDEMKRFTYYEGYSVQDKEIQWFWSTVENFNEEEKAKLIQFITGSSQVPVEGFVAFQPRITIGRSYSPRGNLPQAHTCFNKMDLPEYESCSDLAKKLLIAITEGVEGFGFS